MLLKRLGRKSPMSSSRLCAPIFMGTRQSGMARTALLSQISQTRRSALSALLVVGLCKAPLTQVNSQILRGSSRACACNVGEARLKIPISGS